MAELFASIRRWFRARQRRNLSKEDRHGRSARFETLEARRLLTAEVEPNDTFGTATLLALDDPTSGYDGILDGQVSDVQDIDFFAFELTQGQRFQLSTGNQNAGTFSLTLPPGIELMDDEGDVLAVSYDGRYPSFVAPYTGTYHARIHAGHVFGDFADSYGMAAYVTDTSGVSEIEPNDDTVTATALTEDRFILGNLESAGDVDVFKFTGTENHVLTVSFADRPENRPSVRVRTASGTLIATDRAGLGVNLRLTSNSTVYIEVGTDNLASQTGTVTGQYVGSWSMFDPAEIVSEDGDAFAKSAGIFPGEDESHVVGQLSDLNDVDVFTFEVDTVNLHRFSLGFSSSDFVSQSSRVLTLYNQYGQLMTFSPDGSLNTSYKERAITPGSYFLTLHATSEAGLGSYGLSSAFTGGFSPERDVPLYFLDFDEQVTHLTSYDWENAYALPETIPFVTGMFESRYDIYDVDLTLAEPTDNAEFVSQGYGDFGNIGAGYGGGGYGVRRPKGDSLTSASITSWDELSYGATTTMIHEFGHATGLPHARNVQDILAYQNVTELFPVGSHFPFLSTDSRRPGTDVVNPRDYLDWALQAGSQVIETGTNGTAADPQRLDPELARMSLEFSERDSVGVGDYPLQIATGEFNGDDHADLLTANYSSGDVSLLLGVGDGTFQPAVQFAGGTNLWDLEPLAVGDFNDDGNSDFAVAYNSAREVSVYLGNGDGTFQPATTLLPGTYPRTVTAGDLNDDGRSDLIVGGYHYAIVFLSLAGGGFANPVSYTAGNAVFSVALADFDLDGNLDVVTANPGSDDVGLLLGNGDGTLQAATGFDVGTDPHGITAADLDDDGKPDIIVVDRESGAVGVLPGRGDGTFDDMVEYSAPKSPETVTTADLNGDGRLDVLVGGNDEGFSVLLSLEAGGLSRAVSHAAGGYGTDATAADFNGDGRMDIAVPTPYYAEVDLLTMQPDDLRNNRVVVSGQITAADEVDFFSFIAQAGETWWLDVDAAEFQHPLDAEMALWSADETLLATSRDARDKNSGIDSADPYLEYTFDTAGTYLVSLQGQRGSIGNYRLKLTPESAIERDGPRVLGASPGGQSQVDSTQQIVFFLNDQLDPATLTAENVVVQGATTGLHTGTARFSPLDTTLVWTADAPLPIDSYSVTLRSGADGIRDPRGNQLDGETDGSYAWPDVSGDGTPGGDFVMTYEITSLDTSPATISAGSFDRNPYNRGAFQIWFYDTLDFESVVNAEFTLRGAGPDGLLDTPDDRLSKLDIVYDKLWQESTNYLYAFTSGVPDLDRYRIEASVFDGAGHPVTVAWEEEVVEPVPATALFTDASQATSGLTGNYVDASLRDYALHDDWRATQTIAGERVDPQVSFYLGDFGLRSEVGVTGGSDTDWDNFSVQWDGFIEIPVAGTQLRTYSNNGSRLWIDINGDGSFDETGDEFVDSDWGLPYDAEGDLSVPLAPGLYEIRIQFEHSSSAERMYLEWITPDRPGTFEGLSHGPSVVDVSIQPNSVLLAEPTSTVSVTFSGAIDPTTLTTDNIRLRQSADAEFFDNDDTYVTASGPLTWDPVYRRATLETVAPLSTGYYLLELNGSPGGITDTAGHLLDGEYLDSYVAGSTLPELWDDAPSGDGIAGGDYRAFFSVAPPTLVLEIADAAISESGGTATAVVRRLNSDLDAPLEVQLASDNTTEATVPPTVTIASGSSSATFTVTGVDDTVIDGTWTVTITARAATFANASDTIDVTNDDTFEAHAGGPYVMDEGDDLSLNASDTINLSGDALNYSWDLDNDGQYDDATGETPAVPWNTLASLGLPSDGTPVTIGLEVADGDGAARTTTAALTIHNLAPSDIHLSATSVAEEQPIGTVVGTLSSTDADAPETFTYALVPGTGDTDNASFAIDGDELTTAEVFDFGTKSSYSVRVRTTDPDGSTFEEPFTILVTDVNHAPVLAPIGDKELDEQTPLSFTVTAADPNDNPAHNLTLAATNLPTGATFDPNTGNFNWLPTESQQGTYNVTFTVTDDGVELIADSEVVQITVNEVNVAPVLPTISDQTVNEQATLKFTVPAASDQDDPPQTLSYSLDQASLDAGMSINATTGEFSWSPTESQQGIYNVTFTVTDNGVDLLSDSEIVQITVDEVNDAPVLATIGSKEFDEQTQLTFTVTASDPDDDPANALTLSATNLPTGSTFDPNTGAFSWLPTESQQGIYDVTFTVTDDGVDPLSDSEVVQITVDEVNDAPVLATIGSKEIDEKTPLTFTVTATDPDDDPANALTLEATNLPTGATFDPATGEFRWLPTESQQGIYDVTFTVTDDGVDPLSDSEVVQITVNEVNDAPVLAAIGSRVMDEQELLSFTVIATDPDDTPANALTLSATNLPAGATFDPATGEFSWLPTESQQGVYDVTFTVTDNGVDPLNDSEVVQITVNEVNDAPVLTTIGSRVTDEQELLSFTVIATDPDDDPANALTLSATNLPAGATFDPATGEFSWLPTESQQGVYDVTFAVTDDGVDPLNDSEVVQITVNEVNHAPVLTAIGDQVTNEQELLTFTVTATDPDDDPANALTLSATNLPAGATFDPATGEFSWLPTESQQGVYDVTFAVTDDGVDPLNDSEVVQITVNEVNDAPVLTAIGDQVTNEQELLTFTVTATDPDDDPANVLTLAATNLPTGASFDPASGEFSWLPTESQQGIYNVTFTVTDNGVDPLSDSEIVQITVDEVNDAPVLAATGSRVTDEQAQLTFTVAASDPDDTPANALTLYATNLPAGATFDPATGEFSWLPTESQQGVYDVTFTVTDNGVDPLSDSEVVQIAVDEVNDAPVLATIGSKEFDEQTQLTFTVTASDPDDDPANALTLSATNLPTGSTFDPNTGAFSWLPTESQQGIYDVTFTVTDDGVAPLSDSEVVQITVDEVNDAPVLAAIGSRVTDEQELLTFTVTATDRDDTPANALTLSATNLPTGATFDPATGEFSWLPTESQQGIYDVTFTVTDDGVDPLADSEIVQITVDEVNDTPVLAAIGSRVTDEQELLSFTVIATDPDDTPANALTLSATNLPAGATFDPATGEFSWLPTESQQGVYDATFTVTDNGVDPLSDLEVVQITVREVNVAPVLPAISNQTVNEQATLTFTVPTATDHDDPQQALGYSLDQASFDAGMSINASTGEFTWTPSESQGGADYPVTVTVTDNGTNPDNLIASQAFTITVNEINVAPVLDSIGNRSVDEQQLLSFTITATDQDRPADTLTFTLDQDSIDADMAIDPSTGAFSWKPTELQGDASYDVTVTVTDNGTGTLSDSETIQITVNEINVAPVLDSIGNRSVDEQQLLSFTVSATDQDRPADALTFTLDQDAIDTGMAIDPSTGAFSWTPTELQGDASYDVTVTVTDNGTGTLSDAETIQITVNEVNSPPVLATIGDQQADERSQIMFTVAATDPNDQPANTVTLSATNLPTGATFDPNTGEFRWLPTESQQGIYTVTFIATDDGVDRLSDMEEVEITVVEINDAPVLDPIGNHGVNEETELTFTVTASEPFDEPPNFLVLTATNLPAGATFDPDTGQFSWRPTESQQGTYTVRFTVTDDGVEPLSNFEDVRITVKEVNDAPILHTIGNKVIDEKQLLQFTVTASDSDDEPPNNLTLTAMDLPSGATFDPDTGQFSWQPTEPQQGTYLVRFTVTDDGVDPLATLEEVEIKVNEVNDPPVASGVGTYVMDQGDRLNLDASASSDPEDDPLTFTWDVNGDGTFDDATGATPEIQWNTLNTLGVLYPADPVTGLPINTVSVRVADPSGESATALATLTIFDNSPIADIQASPTPAAVGQPITFDGSGSTHGHPGRSIVSYEWDFDYDGQTFTVDETGATASHSYGSSASYTAALRVTDDNSSPKTDIFELPVDVISARISVVLVADRSTFDNDVTGERAELPASAEWFDEWTSFYAEIWVDTPQTDNFDFEFARVDLSYNTNYISAVRVEPGPAFPDATGDRQDENGLVANIHGSTTVPDVGDDGWALLARMFFKPGDLDPGIDIDVEEGGPQGQYAQAATDAEFVLSDAAARFVGTGESPADVGETPETEFWPVIYDLDDSKRIGFSDFTRFAGAYREAVDFATSQWAWLADWDRSGRVGYGDFLALTRNFRKTAASGQKIEYVGLPDNWREPGLRVETDAPPSGAAVALSYDLLAPVFEAAIDRTESSEGDEAAAPLDHVEFEIVDLPGDLLGRAVGDDVVQIDVDAAGFGWYVDTSPGDDVEYSQHSATGNLSALPGSSAADRVDLLTVILHELGHVLGHDHEDEGIMQEALPLGTRRLPDESRFDVACEAFGHFDDPSDSLDQPPISEHNVDEVFSTLCPPE